MSKDIVYTIGIILALTVGGFAVISSDTQVIEPNITVNIPKEALGAQPGPVFECASASWNPVAVDVDTQATTSLSAFGAKRGMPAFGFFDSPTTTDQWFVTANVATSSEVWVTLHSTASTSVNLTTSTVWGCFSKSFIY